MSDQAQLVRDAVARMSPGERRELLAVAEARIAARDQILGAVDDLHRRDLEAGEDRLSAWPRTPEVAEAAYWIRAQDRGHHMVARDEVSRDIEEALRLPPADRKAGVRNILERERRRVRARAASRVPRLAAMLERSA